MAVMIKVNMTNFCSPKICSEVTINLMSNVAFFSHIFTVLVIYVIMYFHGVV